MTPYSADRDGIDLRIMAEKAGFERQMARSASLIQITSSRPRRECSSDARHQLRVFHVLKELHKHVLDALRRLRRGLSRRGQRGRKRKPGRPAKARARRRGLTNKEKSASVFEHRWLIVRRRDEMSDQERADLATTLSYLPELATLRDFVGRLGLLFEDGQSEATARRRRAALVSDRSFLSVPELAKAIGALGSEKSARMIAFQ